MPRLYQDRSMLIAVRCTKCGASFYVEDRFIGKTGRCPRKDCGRRYVVPEAPAKHRVTTAKSRRERTAVATAEKPQTRRPRTPPAAKPKRTRTAEPATQRARRTPPPIHAARRRRSPRKAKSVWQQGWVRAVAAVCLVGAVAGLFFLIDGPETPEDSQSTVGAGEVSKKPQRPNAATDEAYTQHVQPLLKKYCHDCHADGVDEAGLALDKFPTADSVLSSRKQWNRVLQMVKAGAMPPGEHETQPTMEERDQLVTWIDDKLHWVDCSLPPDPGHVTLRRLNRAEYNNTIRDLLAVDFQPASDFPSDEVGYGFDNIGDVLSLPPLLLEKYLDAAEEISEKTIVGEPAKLAAQRVEGEKLNKSGGAGSVSGRGFVSMASNGSVWSQFQFPVDGEYTLRAEAAADQAGGELAKMRFLIDGKPIKTFDVKGHRKPDVYETKFRMKRGRHKFEAAFINDYYNPKARNRRDRDRNMSVRFLAVSGPANVSLDGFPEPHRRLVITRPKKGESPRAAATQVLKAFLPRAFRRPVQDDEVSRFAALVEMAVKRGDTYEQGIQLALQAVLVSPHFLFRVESQPKPGEQTTVELNDYEIASRLSYFLWSSMPDEELFQAAARGQLRDEPSIRQQVRRMLKDQKSQSLVDNFATQWLNLRVLDEIEPDPKQFPSYGKPLREDMKRESMEFFAAVMREDRNIFDFLDGNFTYVNERLAKHYGINGVRGEEFQKVSLTGQPRAGVLTQASILTLTSNPTRTSPVKRGKWVMENLLGTPPPPPPPDVPELEEAAKTAPAGASLRKQLEIHREDAGCASCHRTMDAIGFGFENFDAIGRWRDRDDGAKIDATAELPGSGHFNGPLELLKLLKQRDTEFRRTFVERMLTFGLGRGLEYYDRCTVENISEKLAANGNRFSVLMEEVAVSAPFRQRRGGK